MAQALDVSVHQHLVLWQFNQLANTYIPPFQVGTVWVNCSFMRDLNVPFGGAKMSGVGREGLKDSLEFYTEVKTVCIKH